MLTPPIRCVPCWGQEEHSQHRCTNLPSQPKKKKIPFPQGGGGVWILEWNLAVNRELMLEKCARSGVAQYFSRGLWSQPAWIHISTYTLFCLPIKGAS